jgi:hypothetical protein
MSTKVFVTFIPFISNNEISQRLLPFKEKGKFGFNNA